MGTSRQRVYQLIEKDPELLAAFRERVAATKDQLQSRKKKEAHVKEIYTHSRTAGFDPKTEVYKDLRRKYTRKKVNSKRAGVEFALAFADIVWPTVCPVLGITLDYYAIGITDNSPSFDRINPTKGYIKGNVQVISCRANRIKNNGTAEEHRLISLYIDKNPCQG